MAEGAHSSAQLFMVQQVNPQTLTFILHNEDSKD